MSDVIIEVRGGNVVGVYSHSRTLQVTIVDWDNWEATNTSDAVYIEHSLLTSKLPKETVGVIASSKIFPTSVKR
jgi:hypothetical protein